MNLIKKINFLLWFAFRFRMWPHAIHMILRKLKPDFDSMTCKAEAAKWAEHNAVSLNEVLQRLHLRSDDAPVPMLHDEDLEAAAKRVADSGIEMGGAAAIDLLYSVVFLSQSTSIIETGVAFGWSSTAILCAQRDAELHAGRLVSVDMPYPRARKEAYVGLTVPEELKQNWTLITKPDRNGIKTALSYFKGSLDLVHYDSDKSWYGRAYGYPLLWDALRPGGIFITDDIQDNLYFKYFVENKNLNFCVMESSGKFVGIIKKQ